MDAFIERDGQDDGKRDAEDQLAHTVHQRIPDKFPEIVGMDERLEVVQSHPLGTKDTIQGHVILECDLTVPDRHILEKDVIRKRDDQDGINTLMPLDLTP
jgi:hypothetical protein